MAQVFQDEIFEVGIIGGGIAGAGIARDAVLRGLSVVLFEKNTFGSGTSSKSSKLIHGGIRYLDLAWRALKRGNLTEFLKNFCFVLFSLRESRILERIAPDLIQPLSLLIPIYRTEGRNVFSVYSGTFLYALLGILTGNWRFPKILHGAEAVLKELPELAAEHLAGGVVIWDHWTRDQQLVEATVRSAERSGAKVFERAEVTRYHFNEARSFFELEAEINGERKNFRVKKLINASGAWVDRVRQKAGRETGEDLIVPVAGSHIILKKFLPCSVILEAADGRIFFGINIDGTTRVGTTERHHEDPDQVAPTAEEVDYLLTELRRYFPGREFREEDILSRDAGIRPLAHPKDNSSAHHISREHEIRLGPSGVIHVLGVKLTDHRRAARLIVDRIAPGRRCLTHAVPLRQ